MWLNSCNRETRDRGKNHKVFQKPGPAFLTPLTYLYPNGLSTRPHAWLSLHWSYSSSSSSLTLGFQIQIPICPTVDELIPGHGPRFPTASWSFPSGCKQSPQTQNTESELIISPPTPALLLLLHLMTQAITLSFLLDAPSTLLSTCKSNTRPWQFYLLNVFLKAGCCSVFLDHCTQLRKASYRAPCLQSLPRHSSPSVFYLQYIIGPYHSPL